MAALDDNRSSAFSRSSCNNSCFLHTVLYKTLKEQENLVFNLQCNGRKRFLRRLCLETKYRNFTSVSLQKHNTLSADLQTVPRLPVMYQLMWRTCKKGKVIKYYKRWSTERQPKCTNTEYRTFVDTPSFLLQFVQVQPFGTQYLVC